MGYTPIQSTKLENRGPQCLAQFVVPHAMQIIQTNLAGPRTNEGLIIGAWKS